MTEEKVEQERKDKEDAEVKAKLEGDRIAKSKAEADRIAKEKAEKERKAKLEAEAKAKVKVDSDAKTKQAANQIENQKPNSSKKGLKKKNPVINLYSSVAILKTSETVLMISIRCLVKFRSELTSSRSFISTTIFCFCVSVLLTFRHIASVLTESVTEVSFLFFVTTTSLPYPTKSSYKTRYSVTES